MSTDDERPGDDDPVLRSGRVRIVGAEPAGGSPPPEEEPPVDEAPGTELPHWTEAPTGEVPAVLARGEGGDQWSSLPGPTWREEHADWTAHEEGTYEASILAEDDARLGSLDDSGVSDRQPWSFELPDQDTMVVPVVPPVDRPLAPEEPGEVAFRFDEEDGVPGAVPSETRGGTTAVPRAGRDAEPDGPPAVDGGLAVKPPEPEPEPEPEPLPEPEPQPAERGTVRPSPEAPRRPARPVAPEPPRRPPPVAPPEQRETRSGRDLPVAIVSGLVLGIVALVFFKLGTVTSMLVVTVVVTVAAMEAYAAFRRAGHHPATLLGLVATVSLMVATYNKGQEALPLVIVLLVACTMLWYLAGIERTTDPVRSTASTLLVFCWVAVFGSFAALLLDPTLFPDRHGIAFLLGAVIAGVAYDVGALAVGAWVGRHPLTGVSPNKTWEGLVGGAVAAVLAGVIVVHLIHPWTLGAAVVLGLVVAVVSPIGDLSESLVKRHLGLKDMGRILPGHGGLLDRVDGLLFVLPATYFLVKAFNLG